MSSIRICYDGLHSLHGLKVTWSNYKTCLINTGYPSIARYKNEMNGATMAELEAGVVGTEQHTTMVATSHETWYTNLGKMGKTNKGIDPPKMTWL